MADQKDQKEVEATPAKGSHYVVLAGGASLAEGGAAFKNHVVPAKAFGDAARLDALVKNGAVRAATATEAKLDTPYGEAFPTVENKPEPGETVESIDAQIKALEERKAALVAAEKAAKSPK